MSGASTAIAPGSSSKASRRREGLEQRRRDRSEGSAPLGETITGRRQPDLRDQLRDHAPIKPEHQPQTRLVRARLQNLRAARQVERGYQEAVGVVHIRLVADQQLLRPLDDENDAGLHQAGARFRELLAPEEGKVRDRGRAVLLSHGPSVDDIGQVCMQGVKRPGLSFDLILGRHGCLSDASWAEHSLASRWMSPKNLCDRRIRQGNPPDRSTGFQACRGMVQSTTNEFRGSA